MHDDVKSGKSVPHWQGDFLRRSLIGLTPGGVGPSDVLLAPLGEEIPERNVAPEPVTFAQTSC